LLSQADAAALVDVHGITDGSSTRSELESESNQMKTPASDRNSSNREKNPGKFDKNSRFDKNSFTFFQFMY